MSMIGENCTHDWSNGFHACAKCGVSWASLLGIQAVQKPNAYTTIDAAPEYTDAQKAHGKALGNAVSRL